jgi:hypothetical protein
VGEESTNLSATIQSFLVYKARVVVGQAINQSQANRSVHRVIDLSVLCLTFVTFVCCQVRFYSSSLFESSSSCLFFEELYSFCFCETKMMMLPLCLLFTLAVLTRFGSATTQYLVVNTHEGASCDSGSLENYLRYTLDACMYLSASYGGYKIQSGKYAAAEHSNHIALRMHVYTDDSCQDYYETFDIMKYNTTCTTQSTFSPTLAPTEAPTKAPTATPSTPPTAAPSATPTRSPTVFSVTPTARPTHSPTVKPSSVLAPTATPTASPTRNPTVAPTYSLKNSLTDWDDQFIIARVSGEHSVVAEITTEDSLPSENGFFTQMSPYTDYCSSVSTVFMYHWTANEDDLTARCKTKAWIAFTAYKNSTVGGALNPVNAAMRVTLTSGASGSTTYPLGSADVRQCFAGTELVQLADGSSRMISDLQIGDEILSADRSGKLGYSPVVAIPHPKTSAPSEFIQLVTKSGKDIQMTAEHLVAAAADCKPSATPSLLSASSIRSGMCLYSMANAINNGVYGMDEVVDVKFVRGQGAFTVVPMEEMIIVNGFLASPFAFNHAVNTGYYNMWRSVYWFSPNLSTTKWLHAANEMLGALAVSLWRK